MGNTAGDAASLDAASRGTWGGYAVDRQTQGMSGALEALLRVERLGTGLMLAIGGVLCLLVLLVGPMGRSAVRRSVGLSRSWLFAVVAVGLATVLAALLPRWVRSGKSTMAWASVVDVVCDASGTPQHAWSSSVIGVFAGKQTGVRLLGSPDAKADAGASPAVGAAPGSFVRGFSPKSNDYYGQRGERAVPTGQPLAIALDSPTLGGLRGHLEASTIISQWNLRAFTSNDAGVGVETGLLSSLPSVSLRVSEQSGSPAVAYAIDNLPEGEVITGLSVLFRHARAEAALLSPTGSMPLLRGATSITMSEYRITQLGPSWMSQSTTPTSALITPFRTAGIAADLATTQGYSGIGASLRRAFALDAQVALGAHAVVLLRTSTKRPPGIAADISDEGRAGDRLYRISVPLSDELREHVDSIAPPPQKDRGPKARTTPGEQSSEGKP
jgi:hypothetical protein